MSRPENPEPLIEARGVWISFDGNPALAGVDIAIRPGEIVSLIGPNGAGKTTLVRILLGLLAPDAGEVRKRPGLRVGYLPQEIRIDPVLPMTVHRLLCLPYAVSEEAIRHTLAEVKAPGLLKKQVHVLSGGEMQRVLLARALLQNPDLLVLDEPAQNVDVAGQAELYELIARIRAKRGCGVLMISHDLHLVMAATDQVVCINHHLCCSGEPEAVSRHPEYMALFGDQSARSFAVYTHAHDHHHGLSGEVVTEKEKGTSSGGHAGHDHADHTHGEHAHGEHEDDA
ncbi:MAG: zinc ABC transporter ATP-binding protein ZnuC [bacterium]|nr:zinc ABC transporter ATP-binding protein ZnuC [bacterium]